MTLKLNGSSSGYTAIDAPAAAGSNTLVLPTNNGSANQILQTDGSGNLSWVDKPSDTQLTHSSISSLSGTNEKEWTLTGNVKKIDVNIYKASHNGGSGGSTNTYFAFLLGDSGGYATSGAYDNVNMRLSAADSNASTVSQSRLAWCYFGDAPDNKLSGYASFRLVGTDSGNDQWVYDFKGADDLNDDLYLGTGFCNSGISGLSKIKFFTYNSAHNFDMGNVSLNYWTA